MLYSAKIRTTSTIEEIFYVEVDADSGDEAEELIRSLDYEVVTSQDIDYYDTQVEEILEIEPLPNETN